MTEVRPYSYSIGDNGSLSPAASAAAASSTAISSPCLGLFATRAYRPGDVILDEDAPLMRLAPTSVQQEDEIFQENRHLFPSGTIPTRATATAATAASTINKKRGRPKRDSDESDGDDDDDDERDNDKNGKKRTTLWNSINVPSTVPSGFKGKFKGMVIAALCFRHEQKQQQGGGVGGREGAPQNNMDKLSKLLELYHPDVASSSSNTTLSSAELQIVDVAQRALDFVLATPNNTKEANKADRDEADDPVLLKKIMLIWTCNSFQGGRIYERTSRINHSCSPNAVIVVVPSSTTTTASTVKEDGMQVRAATHIQPGDEISISYLSLYMYAQRSVRQAQLLQTKHFTCRCTRCCGGGGSVSSRCGTVISDTANMIPCPACHPRIHATGFRQLEEDVQYDDDETVAYAVAKKKKRDNDSDRKNEPGDGDDGWFWECSSCQSTFATSSSSTNDKKKHHSDNNESKSQQHQYKPLDRPLAAAMQQVVKRVVEFIQDHEALLHGSTKPHNKALGDIDVADDDDDDDKETAAVLQDLLQEHVTLASNVMGARHWTTSLLLLLQLDAWLSDIHSRLLTRATNTKNKGGDNDTDETLLESIAQAVDTLQRLITFVNGFSSSSNAAGECPSNGNSSHGELVLHRGHLLSSVILGTVRALVSLGDAKSQKYASEWLKQLDLDGDTNSGDNEDFVTQFESPAMQKVVAALRVAWIRNATVASVTASNDDNDAKQNDPKHSNKKLKKR